MQTELIPQDNGIPPTENTARPPRKLRAPRGGVDGSNGAPSPAASLGDVAPGALPPAPRSRRKAPAAEIPPPAPEKPKAQPALSTMAKEVQEQLRREFAAAMVALSQAATRATRRRPIDKMIVIGWARAVVDTLLAYISESAIVFIRLAIQTGALVAAFVLSPRVDDAECQRLHELAGGGTRAPQVAAADTGGDRE